MNIIFNNTIKGLAIFVAIVFVVFPSVANAQYDYDYGTYTSNISNAPTFDTPVTYTQTTSNTSGLVDYGTYTSNISNAPTFDTPTTYTPSSNTGLVDYGTYTSNISNNQTFDTPVTYTVTTPSDVSYTPAVYADVTTPLVTFGGATGGYYYTTYGSTGGYYPATYGSTVYNYTSSNSTNNTGSVSCPSGTNYVNGVCQPNTQCPAGQSYLNGVCVPTTQCPTGTTLVNNVCQPTTVCPSGTTLSNGTCVTTTVSCPSGSTLVNGTCVVTTTQCPAGTTLVNGVCTTTTTTCSAGTTLINGVCTTTTTINYYTCPNGTVVNYSYQCPAYTYPTYNYQTCWNGSVIPLTSVCPNQYKVCPNGTSIPVNQTCYTSYYNTYYTQPVVKFNNVVTSPATQVTMNAGRCNGIGLIANGTQSTGWFEYGETSSLGRETAKASIGNNHTAPFSNLLTNLKPNTRYYCRAVMQNQYGVVKGEIIGFTTKGTKVTYIQPVVKKTTTKKVVKKQEVTCTDGTTSWVKDSSTASMLDAGEKLVAFTIDQLSSDYAVNGKVLYKVSFKNRSNSTLSGVVISVVLPQEVEVTSSTAGTYDVTTRTLTINPNVLGTQSEGTVTIEGKVASTAQIGKSIVTTGYVVYTVPSTSTQDEITAYVVGSVSPEKTVQNDVGAKKVYGAGTGKSFLPNTLVEWLALIAIIFIIFILARSIYLSYKRDREEH
jgi:hypothetical protein